MGEVNLLEIGEPHVKPIARINLIILLYLNWMLLTKS